LESLHYQTLDKGKFEVILILNGCCEPYKTEIEKYVVKNGIKNLRLIQTDEPGVSNARNLGMDIACGEYITFIDDDDYVSADYLDSMLEVAVPSTVVLTNSMAFVDHSNVLRPTYKPHVVYTMCMPANEQRLLKVRSIFNGPCMKLLPREFLNGAKYNTKLSQGEDGLFMYEISRYFKSFSYAQESAIYYRRIRESSLSTTEKSQCFWIKNSLTISTAMLFSWLKHPFSYNFCWTVNRMAANLKHVYIHTRLYKNIRRRRSAKTHK
jgi:glycosyltransferase involved in cell wall biosynthesis